VSSLHQPDNRVHGHCGICADALRHRTQSAAQVSSQRPPDGLSDVARRICQVPKTKPGIANTACLRSGHRAIAIAPTGFAVVVLVERVTTECHYRCVPRHLPWTEGPNDASIAPAGRCGFDMVRGRKALLPFTFRSQPPPLVSPHSSGRALRPSRYWLEQVHRQALDRPHIAACAPSATRSGTGRDSRCGATSPLPVSPHDAYPPERHEISGRRLKRPGDSKPASGAAPHNPAIATHAGAAVGCVTAFRLNPRSRRVLLMSDRAITSRAPRVYTVALGGRRQVPLLRRSLY